MSPTTTTTRAFMAPTLELSSIGAIIGTSVGIVLVIFAAVIGFKFCRSRNKPNWPEDNDVNPTYGDYGDYSEPVMEVEDSNVYYSDTSMHGASGVRDNNSLYGEKMSYF